MVPKMKEIQKVVQKLSREQESAAGGRRRSTNRYKNIKSPSPVYRGDLKMRSAIRCQKKLCQNLHGNTSIFTFIIISSIRQKQTAYNDVRKVTKLAIWQAKSEVKKERFTKVSPNSDIVFHIAKQMDHTN